MTDKSLWQSRDAMMFRASTNRFTAWLELQGALVLDPASDYEVMRWRAVGEEGGKVRTHIVYRTKDGALTWGGSSRYHWDLFVGGNPLPAQPDKIVVPKRQKSWTQRMREALLERDGSDCFYCGKTMIGHDHTGKPTKDGRDDITIEHMLSKHNTDAEKAKGVDVNHIDYLTLAHRVCNRLIGHRPVHEKIIYREIAHDQRTDVDHWR